MASRSTSTAGAAAAAADADTEARIDAFLARYTPALAVDARACRQRLQALLPRGCELVYDNYNALVFGYGPTERASQALFSVAVYPRWVTLFFLHGIALDDPQRLLQGSGARVRHIRLAAPADLDRPAVRALLLQVLQGAAAALGGAPPRQTVIRSVSPRQRARLPAAAAPKPSLPMLAAVTLAVAGLTGLSALPALAAPTAPAVRGEIDALLARLQRSGCQFNRNGTWYDAADVRAHLLRKLTAVEDATTLRSTEQFIDAAASFSSMSQQPYLVRCGSATPVPSRDWLLLQLQSLRTAPPLKAP